MRERREERRERREASEYHHSRIHCREGGEIRRHRLIEHSDAFHNMTWV